jgi:hypothetical protein
VGSAAWLCQELVLPLVALTVKLKCLILVLHLYLLLVLGHLADVFLHLLLYLLQHCPLVLIEDNVLSADIHLSRELCVTMFQFSYLLLEPHVL